MGKYLKWAKLWLNIEISYLYSMPYNPNMNNKDKTCTIWIGNRESSIKAVFRSMSEQIQMGKDSKRAKLCVS